MKAARIDNGVVADLWEVPALDCYDGVDLIEATAECGIGWVFEAGQFSAPAVDVSLKLAQAGAQVRANRNRLLASSDWTQCRDIPEEISAPWAVYRQALRDITTQAGFPESVVWPASP